LHVIAGSKEAAPIMKLEAVVMLMAIDLQKISLVLMIHRSVALPVRMTHVNGHSPMERRSRSVPNVEHEAIVCMQDFQRRK